MQKGHQKCISTQSFKGTFSGLYGHWETWTGSTEKQIYPTILGPPLQILLYEAVTDATGHRVCTSGKEWCHKSFQTLDPHHRIQAAVPRELPLTCGRADGPLSIPALNFSMAEHLYWCCLSNSVVLTLNIASAPSSCCTHHSMSATLCPNLKLSLLSCTPFCCSSTLCPSDPATCFWTQSSGFYFILSVPSLQWRT